ncbi:trypsin-like peptidase domain-containing protein [Streptomyces sp. NPDC006193]|uniref:S1C family serine protease n=1 Tax=Streptomyces sp. NPDC006193 TaxID=3155717 RepID=UPI0033BD2110
MAQAFAPSVPVAQGPLSAPTVPGAQASVPAPAAQAPAPSAPVAQAFAPSVPVAQGPLSAPTVPGAQASVPAPATQAPAPSGSVAQASAPVASVPAGAVGAGAEAAPAAGTPDPGPWGRYDPWAAASAAAQAAAQGPLQQTGPAPRRTGRAERMPVPLAWTLVVALVSAGIGGVAGACVERAGRGDGGTRPPQSAPDSVAGIAARALPSVVTLHVRGDDGAGTGTGFVLDARGHILTNNHVVEPAGSDGAISVTFSDGDTAEAEIVGRDSGYDLAVVRVRGGHGLTPLPLGDSDDVKVGDPVVAIGAPFDLANTVTSGIVSAKDRPITAGGERRDGSDLSYVDALQTDAPINPGNSGGPLLDSRGEVIGINSAIRSAGGGSGSSGGQAGSIGLGFAIPVNQAKRVAGELIDDGRATHPVIGVTLDMGWSGDGARIDTRSASGGPAVAEGGPGARAGLTPGDVITRVDGERVHTAEELIVRIRAHRPGDRLRLTVHRDGAAREISLVLGASERD